MSDQLITAIVSVLTAIIGVAIIATILSKSSNTSNVIGAGSSGFSNMLKTALSPLSGSGVSSLVNGLVTDFGPGNNGVSDSTITYG
jgi:hypothetical protein